jgi:hypothetical protein
VIEFSDVNLTLFLSATTLMSMAALLNSVALVVRLARRK